MLTTTNYGFKKPEPSDVTTKLRVSICDNADIVDTKLTPHVSGLYAALPAASPGKAGRTYRCTDTDELFLDNGVAWVKIPQGTDLPLLGLSESGTTRRGKSIIATSQATGSATYTTLATPDLVTVTLPTDGLLYITYHATWSQTVASAARAAIFLSATQLKGSDGNTGVPVVSEAGCSATANQDHALYTSGGGLVGNDQTGGWSDVTTGQVIGQVLGVGGGSAPGGQIEVFAAAGTYDVSVKFKASSGTVTASNRKLWVKAEGY